MARELVGDGNGYIDQTVNGATSHREFVCSWEEAYSTNLMGTTHPRFPLLNVEHVRIVPLAGKGVDQDGGRAELVRVEVDYAYNYKRPKVGDPPRVGYEIVSEALLTGQGRIWDDCHEVVESDDLSTATVYKSIRITTDMAVAAQPIETIKACVNCVNDSEWQGCAAGTVLFEDFKENAELDWDTNEWFFRTQYTFLKRDRPHNEVWRGPIPKRVNGIIQYYQGTDPDGDNYDADMAKDSHPVPKDTNESYTPGIAGWTTTTPKLYEEADFSAVLS